MRPTSRSLTLRVPMPPTSNHYWRFVIINRQARIVMSTVGKQYRKAVQVSLVAQEFETIYGRCAVHVTLHRSNRRQFDLDNRLKPLLDALVHCEVIADDSRIDDLRIVRSPTIRETEWADVVIEEKAEAELFV